jgi:hypothetical protein
VGKGFGAIRDTILIRILSEGDRMEREQRRSPRYPFFASAELIEDKSDVRITSRLSELGLYGCYLDMMNPFPAGTSVLIKISEGEAKFESRATVVYSQPNMGMGVAFQNVEERYVTVLQNWMAKVKPR